MKLKALKEHLQRIPDDYDVTIGTYIIREGDTNLQYFAAHGENFIAINDDAILGISQRDDMKQVCIIGLQKQVMHFGSGDFSKDSE